MAGRWGMGFLGGIVLFFFCLFGFPASLVAAEQPKLPDIKAEAYYIMDFETGATLAEYNAEEPRAPASMTKMMSAFVVLDQIKAGKLRWDDKVEISKRAAAIPEAKIDLKPGKEETVRTLFDAMLIQSANNATVALAEKVGRSEEGFVALMNKKAKELGMKNTQFRTASGLDEKSYGRYMPAMPAGHRQFENNVMSAHDTAILARKLIQTHPEVLKTTETKTKTLREGTSREEKIKNWNLMLPSFPHAFEGVDGIKTGHTDEAGYCFTGTAKRGELRLITVIMGAKSDDRRFIETKKLLEYGFEHYELKTMLTANQPVPKHSTLALPNGVEREVPVGVKTSVKAPVLKGEDSKYTYQVQFDPAVKAPLKKGDVVGQVKVLYNGKEIKNIDPVQLTAQADVEEASSIRLFFRDLFDSITSWFR
ncbi:D-alanyl-D-alanine carboxypeptidase family protein [Thermoflavimicrobium dichotomicum]|uniref:serine-type D-Ala-D-Ala carboxypeptidase n=1 Tax=Thermoflavimicrobium dichotomicum TaxID=46223 RepID=A0A1I3KFC7_9BACL|nr:D-alanyl-D-alanine carboxypeptidase family protein [Thermoflavimicrobium dichotomicum]SFI71050.1 D-alanyl-D-alanine carboxypeptidase (penicillin-binding protein 5/6) [Thermoflavimicrobium dichotomicum]